MASDEIKLNKKTFEALASETRIGILKSLDVRQMTITELAGGLDMAKSSVHEHLQKMTDAGLVEKRETERKWTYYHLTKEGRQILHPHETAKILILIGLSIVAMVSGVSGIYNRMTQSTAQALSRSVGSASVTMEAAPEAASMAPKATPAPEAAQAIPTEPLMETIAGYAPPVLVFLILIAVAFLMGYSAFRIWRKMNPKMEPAAGD